MKDTGNVQLGVQEMISCYHNTDPLRELSRVKGEADPREAAVKALALLALHGINHEAEKITIERGPDDAVTVRAEYRTRELPSPGSAVGEALVGILREITHIEGKEGKSALALGVGDSSVELQVKVKTKEGKELVVLKFPEK